MIMGVKKSDASVKALLKKNLKELMSEMKHNNDAQLLKMQQEKAD